MVDGEKGLKIIKSKAVEIIKNILDIFVALYYLRKPSGQARRIGVIGVITSLIGVAQSLKLIWSYSNISWSYHIGKIQWGLFIFKGQEEIGRLQLEIECRHPCEYSLLAIDDADEDLTSHVDRQLDDWFRVNKWLERLHICSIVLQGWCYKIQIELLLPFAVFGVAVIRQSHDELVLADWLYLKFVIVSPLVRIGQPTA